MLSINRHPQLVSLKPSSTALFNFLSLALLHSEDQKLKKRKMSYQMRSVSFPARSQHPIIPRIETELNKLQSWHHDHSVSPSSTMAEAVFYSLSRLEELHDCMDEILSLPSTRQALSNNAQSSLLDSLLDASLKLLDVCNCAKDAVLGIKEHVQDLQTTVRRRRTGLDLLISNYITFSKRMRKEAKRNISMLKQVEEDLAACSLPQNTDQQLLSLVRGVKDVILTNASIFESLLMFVSVKESFMEGSSSTLQTVNIIVEGMESSLERVFRCLIKTRASFLNIRSY